MTLLPLCALRGNRRWIIRFLPFLVLVAAQMLFGHDTERYLILAFPAFLIFALNGLERLSERFRVPAWSWTLVPLILIAFELTLREPYFLPLRYHALALALALALIGATARLLPQQPARAAVSRAREAAL
jgi:4-amino-4-deoxy-L-arabinose transferase-like glycosyltransferase